MTAWEEPTELLLAKVKNACGRIGIFNTRKAVHLLKGNGLGMHLRRTQSEGMTLRKSLDSVTGYGYFI